MPLWYSQHAWPADAADSHAHLAHAADNSPVLARHDDGTPIGHGYTPPLVPAWHSQSNGTTKLMRSIDAR